VSKRSVRRIRYLVASSLDGYIAGPKGEADWIISDPDFDFRALYNEFDTVLLGRRTFETMVRARRAVMPGMNMLVFSRTLRQSDYPGVTMVAGKPEEALANLGMNSVKDVWLFGGGVLFRSLLDAGLVDTVEVAITPILLGGGIPLLPAPANEAKLKLTNHHVYKTGVVSLQYTVK